MQNFLITLTCANVVVLVFEAVEWNDNVGSFLSIKTICKGEKNNTILNVSVFISTYE